MCLTMMYDTSLSYRRLSQYNEMFRVTHPCTQTWTVRPAICRKPLSSAPISLQSASNTIHQYSSTCFMTHKPVGGARTNANPCQAQCRLCELGERGDNFGLCVSVRRWLYVDSQRQRPPSAPLQGHELDNDAVWFLLIKSDQERVAELADM